MTDPTDSQLRTDLIRWLRDQPDQTAEWEMVDYLLSELERLQARLDAAEHRCGSMWPTRPDLIRCRLWLDHDGLHENGTIRWEALND